MLGQAIGHDIITASGATLLGADDKAGVAAIVAAAELLMAHPEIPHGRVRLAFTTDEEIGRGTAHFDVARFGAACAYTLDGGGRGEIESESFSADQMTVAFRGFNTHPGDWLAEALLDVASGELDKAELALVFKAHTTQAE